MIHLSLPPLWLCASIELGRRSPVRTFTAQNALQDTWQCARRSESRFFEGRRQYSTDCPSLSIGSARIIALTSNRLAAATGTLEECSANRLRISVIPRGTQFPVQAALGSAYTRPHDRAAATSADGRCLKPSWRAFGHGYPVTAHIRPT